MQKMMITLGMAAFAAGALATAATADDRPATAAERAEIGGILQAAGFSSWRKIEFDTDDRKFEVDDARHSNGKVYDVDIRGGKIIKKDLED
ncbi:PepSY domain-containing protein [Hyphomicrobium sp.]|uniref:PepSY domain-containing protein n=1 Tax=Hyphomicrobium sp. TaxID=82 RepID=UPI0025C2814C|nr:PepSY domain-containing protein [Hyphomicrobium sp.]MCC7253894.1 PepSY domain-containing protein [Hyphomicrobium sp.]